MLAVVRPIFDESYAASSVDWLIRQGLTTEVIRLNKGARLIRLVLRDDWCGFFAEKVE